MYSTTLHQFLHIACFIQPAVQKPKDTSFWMIQYRQNSNSSHSRSRQKRIFGIFAKVAWHLIFILCTVVCLSLCWCAACVCPTGLLLCTRCCGRTSSPRWRMRTVRTERTRPPQLDTPSCPSTTAGCSTLGATSSTRTADVCPPSPGDHSQPANTQQSCMSHHLTRRTQRHGLLVVTFPCVQTTCIGFCLCFVCITHVIFF